MKVIIFFIMLVSFSAAAQTFVYVKAGTFWMGSPDSEEGRFENEWRHQEIILQDFELAAFEVTQREWVELMGENPSYFQTSDFCPDSFDNNMCSDHPVDGVSWEDVQKFIEKKNQLKDGYIYRLPTDAEWEYAARAGTQSAYYFGDFAPDLVRYEWVQNRYEETLPVGEYYVVRGGSWAFEAYASRAAYRGSDEKFHRSITQGFRLVRTADSTGK